MYKYVLLLIAVGMQLNFLSAQKKITISGTVKDGKTGEAMAGTAIYPISSPQNAVSANAYGFYSLTIPSGNDTLVAQYVGYDKWVMILNATKDTLINIALFEPGKTLQEVTVVADKGNQNVTSAQMGAETMTVKEIANIPVILGEQDIMKVLELLPGVKSAGDGNSGFYVRGGGADENLVLLDEAPVYNPGHLLGFFSTFNSDAIKDVTLYKGGMPADYGGRLSSVVDVRMKDGNDQDYSVSGGIGLITSRLTVEGPIKKHKGSFIVSGRAAYAGLFAKLSTMSEIRKSTLYFYDLNLKANYSLSQRDRVYLSGYLGRDVFQYSDEFGLNWGNITVTARWNHIFSEKLFSNTSFIFNNYTDVILVGADTNQATIKSGVQDFGLKEDLQYYPARNFILHFGFNMIYHTFIPGQVTAISSTNSLVNLNIQKTHSLENAVYASNEENFCSWFKMIYGVRFSEFTCLGPQTVYSNYMSDIDNGATYPLDSTRYKTAQPIATYWNLEPRLSLNFIINQHNSIKMSFDRNTQYLHQLANTTSTNPTDLWIPTSKLVKPEISDQVAVGYFGNYFHGALQPSVETYYKYTQNVIDYLSGANLILNQYVESQLAFGNGWSYGVELLVKYKVWKVHGWVAYDWSRTLEQIPAIDNDVPFYAKQDRTHEVDVVAMYDVTKKWNISAVYVFYTGNAVTWPSGGYYIGSTFVPYYASRNGYRMPNYSRLDIGATVQLKKHKRWDHNLNMSVYNVLGRENAYAINFQSVTEPNGDIQHQAVQLSLFRWVPSITYNFKFL